MIFSFVLACLPSLDEKETVNIVDNPYHDADGDGYTETDGDCNDSDPSLNSMYLYYEDADGDEFINEDSSVELCSDVAPSDFIWAFDTRIRGYDCNDTDPSIHPQASEFCDGIDNDCNGNVDDKIDETTPWWYADVDGDGFGRPISYLEDGTFEDLNGDGFPEYALQSCNPPFGYVQDNTDCDDGNADNFPTNIEVCDGIDNNCNGVSDEAGAADANIWYSDVDGDGYPSTLNFIVQCEQPEGFVLAREDGLTDCQDFDVEISPMASEICNNKDDNCDGLIDNDVLVGLTACYIDRDGDGFGNDSDVVGSCSCTIERTDVAGDCDDSSADVFPSQVETCNNIDDNCDGFTDNQAVDPSVYYEDVDADGYGTAQTFLSCPVIDTSGLMSPPSGYANQTGDCDDGNINVNPGEDELCTLLIDENCDGHVRLGAIDYSTFWADADGDGYGNTNNVLEVCSTPVGYIEVDIASLPDVDCDDADDTTFPSANELCNGKLDDCYADDGTLGVPMDEQDLDGDTFVTCSGKPFDPTVWVGDPNVLAGYVSDGVDRSGDCDDADFTVHPYALEICDGIFQDCMDVDIGILDAPDSERDDDGDGYVECQGYDPATWGGSMLIIDGWDCDDSNPTTYPGAVAVPATGECFADDDGDGIADCSLDGTGSWSDCEPEVMLDYFGQQMDFAFIPAGTLETGSTSAEYGRKASNEPRVTVSFSQDLYAMTSEVTQGMFEATSSEHEALWKRQHEDLIGIGEDLPIYWMSFYMVADFANQVTQRHNSVKGDALTMCYTCTNSGQEDVECEESMNPYTCDGYRLPTSVEWEYIARGDATDAFWTTDGIGHIPSGVDSSNPVNALDDCSTTNWVFDGGNGDNATLSSDSLGDFAWYCANAGGQVHPVRQKEPNFYGLYDVHGNIQELTHDYFHPNPSNPLGFLTVTQNTTTDVAGASSLGVMYRNVKGGNYSSGARTNRIATYGQRSVELPTLGLGIRLVRNVVTPVQ